ncbi:hypothetical protein C5C31_13490 [Rathayibacter rathayi]|uniref:hypothetical protein n=1 Tax=Rathayibacter rathayi TaxID=33887 RepID=UPI000CE7486D|nr:hypothetical protein [Rathayibacter rathayi]PPH19043.1 hypothetical protein C5C31_13490 [Rathayibacter rathayi]PPI70021.1 hypothetical protein C5E12_09690 [Rathayibacter rathayi]
MLDALTADRATAVIVDAVNRGNSSHTAISRRVELSGSTMHRKVTRKTKFTLAEAIQIVDAARLKISEEWRYAARASM